MKLLDCAQNVGPKNRRLECVEGINWKNYSAQTLTTEYLIAYKDDRPTNCENFVAGGVSIPSNSKPVSFLVVDFIFESDSGI